MSSITKKPRNQHSYTSSLGQSYLSPKKRRDKRKANTYFNPLGHDAKRRRLEEDLRKMQNQIFITDSEGPDLVSINTSTEKASSSYAPQPPLSRNLAPDPEVRDDDCPDNFYFDELPTITPEDLSDDTVVAKTSRRLLPDQTALNLYERWRIVLPILTTCYLSYTARTTGKPIPPVPVTLEGECKTCCSEKKQTAVRCLFHDRK